jgi:hypothetical protein
MSTKHTPGPWRLGKNYGAIVADVQTGGPRGCGDVEAYGGHLVAESVASHNAGLIAASPELYEALTACMFALGRSGANVKGGQNRKEWNAARAALAKADGVEE